MSKRERSIFRKRLILQPRSAKRKTYLFAWNPKQWSWDDIDKNIQEVNEKGFFLRRWSCGKNKSISKGDRFFLIKLGEEPKGIIGSGVVETGSHEGENWRGSEGKSLYVFIKFDVLSKEPIIPINTLREISKIFYWSTRASGINIPEPVAKDLEAEWLRRNNPNLEGNREIDVSAQKQPQTIEERDFFDDPIEPILEDEEGRKSLKMHLARERSTRLVSAFKKSLSSFKCSICGFDFEETYGPVGKGFIEAHHKKPVGHLEPNEKVRIEDLAPLCSNCHRMIHRINPIPSIGEFKNLIKKGKNE